MRAHVQKSPSWAVTSLSQPCKKCQWWTHIFFDGVRCNDLGKLLHVLNNLHGICVIGPFERCFHEGTIWIVNRSVIPLIIHKSVFTYFYHHRDIFYSIYINTDKKQNI